MAVEHLADSARGEAELARQLATLTFAGVEPAAGTALQAAVWWNGLVKLGLSPPLVAVHDLGLLLSRPRAARLREPAGPRVPGRLPGAEAVAVGRYRMLLDGVANSEARAALEGAVALR